jgi:hypothetical protein
VRHFCYDRQPTYADLTTVEKFRQSRNRLGAKLLRRWIIKQLWLWRRIGTTPPFGYESDFALDEDSRGNRSRRLLCRRSTRGR